jgi:Bacterial self-protective colicin-like immunity
VQAPTLDEWIRVIRSFVDGSLEPDEFDETYFDYFRRANEAHDSGEPWIHPAGAESVLSDFYVDVDCLSNDPDLFPDISVTPDELRPMACDVLAALEHMQPK